MSHLSELSVTIVNSRLRLRCCPWWVIEHMLRIPSHKLYTRSLVAKMTSLPKPEVGYITYCSVVRGGPGHGHGHMATCTGNLAKFGYVVFLRHVHKRTDRPTYRHSDRNTSDISGNARVRCNRTHWKKTMTPFTRSHYTHPRIRTWCKQRVHHLDCPFFSGAFCVIALMSSYFGCFQSCCDWLTNWLIDWLIDWLKLLWI